MKVTALKILDATVGAALCWLTGWLRYLLGRDQPPRAAVPSPVGRVLVIRPGGMGDMVLLLPALRALRHAFPGLTLDVVCEKRNREVLEMAKLADGIFLYDAHPFGMLRRLRRARYDVAIDTEQFHSFSALMALASRAPVRIGFKITPGRNLLYTHLVNYDLGGYEADQFAGLLRPLGIAEPARVEGSLDADPDALPENVLGRLKQCGGGGDTVVIHAGCTSRYKQWEPEKAADLIDRLAATGPFSFVLVGNRSEEPLAARVLKAAGAAGRVVSLTGQLTVAQTASVIRRAALFVGGDSGLAHVALALGTPTVILFGPSDRQKWGVSSPGHAVVSKSLSCAPCFIFGYHRLCRPVTCMREITVAEVLKACRDVIAARRAGQA